jgi:hypothetical protein
MHGCLHGAEKMGVSAYRDGAGPESTDMQPDLDQGRQHRRSLGGSIVRFPKHRRVQWSDRGWRGAPNRWTTMVLDPIEMPAGHAEIRCRV